MKNLRQKSEKYGLRYDYYLLLVIPAVVWGSFLAFQCARIVNGTISTATGIRVITLSVIVLFAIILLAAELLYRKSMSYILWYKEILNSVPMPLIITGKNVEWQQVNQATREVMDIKQESALVHLHSRHLLDTDGNIVNRVWRHKGTKYRTSGNRLYCDGKHAGYLILLKDEHETPDSSYLYQPFMDEVILNIKRLSMTMHHFRDCTNNLSEHTILQANIITDLSEFIAEIISGTLDDPEVLNQRMQLVKAYMQWHTKTGEAHIEEMRQMIIDLGEACDCVSSSIHDCKENSGASPLSS